jgi:hypothetical protein
VPAQIRTALRAEASKLAQAQVPAVRDERERERLTRLLHESFVHSFRAVMLISSAITLLAAVCAALTIQGTPHPSSRSSAEP